MPPTPKPYVGDVAGYPKALERYIAGCRPEGDLTFFCVGGPPAFPIHL